MPEDVPEWLEKLGLGQYASKFTDNDIDTNLLAQLTDVDLKELGINSLGHRKTILNAIRTLSQNESEPTTTITSKGEAERRQLTVMFCDLVDSTALSEKLDPEDLREVNKAYQDACKAAIDRYEGYVARYMGDGVLAYFGYPQAHEDDAERSIRAGLGVVEAMIGLNRKLGQQLNIVFAVRIGIATGAVVVGDLIGEGGSQESAAVGSTPNLAARLQALASADTVVVAPGTHDLVKGQFEYRTLGEYELKGLAEPVCVRQVIGPTRAESRFAAAHHGGTTSLVGREHEIGLMLDRWQQAKGGDGQIVLLSGEAGIGKSRITETLQDCTAMDHPVRLRYQCSPFHINSALHPVIAQLEHAAGIEVEDENEVKRAKLDSFLSQSMPVIDDIAPLMSTLLSIPPDGRNAPSGMAPERQKEMILEGLVSLVEGLSRQQTVLLIFEDAHWADPTSLEWLELVIDRAQGIPVVVVITFRPEFQPPWSGYTHITSLTLNRFSSSLATAMVDKITGGIRLPAEVLEQIVTKSDGVPLFVEELTKTILESGLLTEHLDQYVLSGPLPEVAVPATLHDSLMARLDRLGPVKEVAQTAAALGREFSYDLLVAVSPLSFAELHNALDQLIDAELVFRRGGSQKGGYIFKHALVQDAAYQSLLKSARLQLHARIAETLEQRYPEVAAVQPEIVAHHYSEAGFAELAIAYWLKAGIQAASHYAHPEAIAYLRLGLALVTEVDEAAKRSEMELELQAALGLSLPAIKGFASPEVGAVYTRAEQLCMLTGNPSSLTDALTGLWYHHVVRGEVQLAQELAARCFTIADEADDPAGYLVAHLALSGMTWFGDFVTGCEHIDKALALESEITEDVNLSIGADARVFVRAFGSHVHWHIGKFEWAAELSEEGIARARAIEEPFTLAIALNYAAMLHQFDHNNVSAQKLTEEAIELCTEHQFAYYLAWAQIIHGWTAICAGGNGVGLAEIRTGLDDFEKTGAGLRLPYYLSLLADGQGRDGQPEKALTTVDLALQRANANGEKWHNADLFRLRAQLLLQMNPGKTSDAETAFQEALNIAREQGCKARELQITTELGRLWQSQGKQSEAHELVAPVYACFPDSSESISVKNAKALLEESL
ncbi:MAG: AAA family ATPase [Gammaproteobacteria bacterium]